MEWSQIKGPGQGIRGVVLGGLDGESFPTKAKAAGALGFVLWTSLLSTAWWRDAGSLEAVSGILCCPAWFKWAPAVSAEIVNSPINWTKRGRNWHSLLPPEGLGTGGSSLLV